MIRPYDREELRRQFRSARPCPHVVIESFLEPAAAERVAHSYPTFESAARLGFAFRGLNEQKKVQVTDHSRFPEPVRQLNQALSAPGFLADLSYITGISRLVADERLIGGGMHVTGPGGRLDVHVDFNYSAQTKLHRRLNILIYLNPVWQPDWGGEIELWDKDVQHCGLRLLPLLNRCLLFETSDISYHGVCPVTERAQQERKSFAAYYYTLEPPAGWAGQVHSTIFRARPDERLRGYLLMPAMRLRGLARAGLRRAKGRFKKLFATTTTDS